jgi:hypothetical protein
MKDESRVMKKRSIRDLATQLAIITFGFMILAGVVLTFIPDLLSEKDPIPANVTGDLRVAYTFALTERGNDLLEQVPCYCGCKNVGHMHTRDCFWTDGGEWDKHGVRCKICVEIAMNTKLMHEDGKSILEIREKIDSHYERVAEYATETPMPTG